MRYLQFKPNDRVDHVQRQHDRDVDRDVPTCVVDDEPKDNREDL